MDDFVTYASDVIDANMLSTTGGNPVGERHHVCYRRTPHVDRVGIKRTGSS